MVVREREKGQFQEESFSGFSVTEADMSQGSDDWFRKVYSVLAESAGIERVSERLSREGRKSEFRSIIEDWVSTQTFFFLTEYGAGKRLQVQPPYLADLIPNKNGEVDVYAFNLRDYGNQKDSYVDFSGIDVAVREGLNRIYSQLATMDENEGMIRLSPSEFYKDFGSHYDVVEFYRVRKVKDDGSRVIEGRYLVLEKVLSQQERLFLINLANSEVKGVLSFDETQLLDYSADNLALNPRKIEYPQTEDPIFRLMEHLAGAFEKEFDSSLLASTDFYMYERIMDRVKAHIGLLVDLLLLGNEKTVINLLRNMMFESQYEWAESKGINPDDHIQKILDGDILLGFEMATEFSDPVANQWFDTKNGLNFCGLHSRSYQKTCMDCEAILMESAH